MNEKVLMICKALSEKKALDIKIVEIKDVTSIADYFVICSGKSAPQVKAIYQHLDEEMSKNGFEPKRHDGISLGKWIALDYEDVIVHIFHSDTRDFYQLDKLWSTGNNVTEYND